MKATKTLIRGLNIAFGSESAQRGNLGFESTVLAVLSPTLMQTMVPRWRSEVHLKLVVEFARHPFGRQQSNDVGFRTVGCIGCNAARRWGCESAVTKAFAFKANAVWRYHPRHKGLKSTPKVGGNKLQSRY